MCHSVEWECAARANVCARTPRPDANGCAGGGGKGEKASTAKKPHISMFYHKANRASGDPAELAVSIDHHFVSPKNRSGGRENSPLLTQTSLMFGSARFNSVGEAWGGTARQRGPFEKKFWVKLTLQGLKRGSHCSWMEKSGSCAAFIVRVVTQDAGAGRPSVTGEFGTWQTSRAQQIAINYFS